MTPTDTATKQQHDAASTRRGIGMVKSGLAAVRRVSDDVGDARLDDLMVQADAALDAIRARAAELARGAETS